MNRTPSPGAPQPWRQISRETLVLGVLGVGALAALAGSAWSTPTMGDLRAAAAGSEQTRTPPAPPPLLVRELAPTDAAAINRSIPIAQGPNPAARPFATGNLDQATRSRAVECLTSAIYYEAGNESADGQRAVAQVVLNRVRHPAFPASVCAVVYEGSTRATGCQFTFTCDGSLARRPSSERWLQARSIAEAALSGSVFAPVGNATHYHADYVVPYWASSLVKNAVVGAHIFYRWSGGWGRPAAFNQAYAQREPDSNALRQAAAAADKLRTEQQAIAEIPGAEPIPGADSKKDRARVAVRFSLAAREAVEAAPRERYVEKVRVSENLRWSLTGASPDEQQKPLGRSATSPNGGGSAAPGSPQ